MADFIATSGYFGLLMTMAFFLFARYVNRKAGKEVFNPLLFSTVCCILFLAFTGISFDTYFISARYLDALLTPTTICLAIPLYRQFELLKKNVPAVLAGCCAGVIANAAICLLLLVTFDLTNAQFVTLLPKSITTAIGKSLSGELGGYPAITMACIMLAGQLGAVAAPALLKLFRVTEPLAQGLAIGTASHAAGTSRAVELGDAQGAASSLAIVVTGLLTVIVAPFVAALV